MLEDLPDARERGVAGWIINDFETLPLGGHYRYEIVDGKVTSNRKFTNSCLALRTDEQDGGKRPVSLGVTHLLDDTPTEIHVFSVFAAKLPIYVSTTSNDRMWAVEVSNGKPRIRIIR